MRHKHLLPLLIPLFVLIFLEWYFFSHKMIYVCLVLINLAIFFATWQFAKNSTVDTGWWNFMVLPGIFSISVGFYSVLLASKVITQILFLIYFVFLYLYLKYLYYYLVQPIFFEKKSLENISSNATFFSFFFFSSAIFGIASFLNISAWILALILLFFTALLSYQFLFINKVNIKDSLFYILLICFVVVEICWSIFFLPINFNLAGISLSVCFYVLINLTKHHLQNNLDSKIIKRYLLFGVLSLLLLLLTSRWI